MRRFKWVWVIIALVVVVAFWSGLSKKDEKRKANIQWKEYSYSEEGFSISTPSEPQRKELLRKPKIPIKNGPIGITVTRFRSLIGKPLLGTVEFDVAITPLADIFPPDKSPDEILPIMKHFFVKSTKAQTTQEKNISYNKHPGIEFVFHVPFYSRPERFDGVVRMYVVGDKAYQLQVFYEPGLDFFSKPNYEEAYKFLDSFKILGLEKS